MLEGSDQESHFIGPKNVSVCLGLTQNRDCPRGKNGTCAFIHRIDTKDGKSSNRRSVKNGVTSWTIELRFQTVPSLTFDFGERIVGKNMAKLKFDKEITALLVIDPYDELYEAPELDSARVSQTHLLQQARQR